MRNREGVSARAPRTALLWWLSYLFRSLRPRDVPVSSCPQGGSCGRWSESNTRDGGKPMKVCDCMSRDVQIANPNQSIREAAQMMARIDSGVLPVGDNDRLVGVITDRDITIRAVAEGKAPTTKVGEVMSHEVLYCFE